MLLCLFLKGVIMPGCFLGTLLKRGVKVNVCDRRIIRVFLSSKTMLHRESWQIKELYLAALT